MLRTPQTNQQPLWLTIILLLRWNKPEGRLILMIPALWAVFLAAAGKPPLPLVGVIIIGSIATSAAGCVVNDLWDRDIDPQVERTRNRPLAILVNCGAFANLCKHHATKWALKSSVSRSVPIRVNKLRSRRTSCGRAIDRDVRGLLSRFGNFGGR